MNIDLANYPDFRSEAMALKANISTMISKMDGIMQSGNFTDSVKIARLDSLVNEYLPS